MNNLSAKLNKLSFHFIFFLKLALKIFTMVAAKKGKKKGSSKKGSKHKKNSSSSFSKILLVLLIFAMLAGAILLTIADFKKSPKPQAAEPQNHKTTEVTTTKQQDNKTVKQQDNKTTKQQSDKTTKQQDSKVNTKQSETKNDIKKTFKEQQNINGCWLSTEQGASLTIDNYGYRIDFFGVDASKPMTGKITISDNTIKFISNSDDCRNEDGSYKIAFDKKNIRLTCKNDNCTKRKNILETEWEWLEY